MILRLMNFRQSLQVALLVLITMFSTACSAQEPMRLPVDGQILNVVGVDGGMIAQFSIEIASKDEQHSAGLMFRKDLPQDRGMLFVFDDEAERFFWMENTPTPLDIVYADSNGAVVHVAANTTPFSRVPIPSRFPARYAFEIHSGLAKQLGIGPGTRLVHPSIENK